MHMRTTIAAACSVAVLIVATTLPSRAQSAEPIAYPVFPGGPTELMAPPGPCDPGGAVPTGYNVIVGTPGDDILIGTPGKDLIRGLAGNDYLFGLEGDDILCGGDG